VGGTCDTHRGEERCLQGFGWEAPVPMASRSKVPTVFDRSNTGIVVSNPARGMDVCPRFSVLCCPV
jgi:hypothetical protein